MVSIVILAPLARLIAVLLTPVVNSTLIRIGDIIQSSTNTNPIIMGIILGGIITVVGTAPLSSMALTALLGLTGRKLWRLVPWQHLVRHL
ncbi:PTS sugar transporter subunit IIC [Staphylococcus aureus]